MNSNKLLLLLFLLWYSNCGISAPQTQIQHLVVAGPQFTLKLTANPSTGYWWHLQQYNHQLLTIAQHRIISSTQHQRVLGQSEQEVWSFNVNQAALAHCNTTDLVFIYARPWDLKQIAQKLIINITFPAVFH